MLTKTSYMEFLRCPQEFWLQTNSVQRTDEDLTPHEKHLREQGYDVQRLAQKMSIFNGAAAGTVNFQRMFQTDEIFTSADIVVTDNKTDEISIYEVKSSASVKPENIDDVAFQKMVAESLGFKVAKTFIITVDTSYTRNGDIDPDKLLKIHDVTDEVIAKQAETITKTAEAFKYLEAEPVPNIAEYCDAKLDCSFIRHHFKDIPEYNVTHISRLDKKKCRELVEKGIIDIRHVPADYKLTEKQRQQVDIACCDKPDFKSDNIKAELEPLKYPPRGRAGKLRQRPGRSSRGRR